MFKKLKINSAEDLMKYFKANMNYGFIYRHKIFSDLEQDFQENMNKLYKIRLNKDFIKNKYGVCWDFCEFERLFFDTMKIEHECFFIESYLTETIGGPTHTFTIFKEKTKWYWFEYSWFYHRGIWEFNSKEEAIKNIIEKFKNFYNNKLININLYKTSKVTKRLNAYEFVNHCLSGQKIQIF